MRESQWPSKPDTDRQGSGVPLRRVLSGKFAIVFGRQVHGYIVYREGKGRAWAYSGHAQFAVTINCAGPAVASDLLRVVAHDTELELRRQHFASCVVKVGDIARPIIRIGIRKTDHVDRRPPKIPSRISDRNRWRRIAVTSPKHSFPCWQSGSCHSSRRASIPTWQHSNADCRNAIRQ